MRSRVSNRLTRDRTELLSLAYKAWNKPRVIHNNAVIPGELQDSTDFDKLIRDGLRIWIKFSGWTRGANSIKRADLIDLARRIQSNPTLVHSTSLTFDKVRSREDLPRLSKASLQKWIRSRGYTVDTLTMEETLNLAYTVWDHVEGVVDAHEAKGSSLAVEIKKISSAKKEVKKVKNRSELSSMNKVQLFDWIVSHEVVVPGNYRHKKQDKSSVLELAENVWDFLEDGGPLPNLLRIRTSPKCRSDLGMMLQKGLRQWIRSHNISIPQTIDGSYEEILSLAEQVWDANEIDTLADFCKSRKPNYIKAPETKMDLRRLTLQDLTR